MLSRYKKFIGFLVILNVILMAVFITDVFRRREEPSVKLRAGNKLAPNDEAYLMDPDCQCRPMKGRINIGRESWSSCSQFSTSRGPGQRVISFALYGPLNNSYFDGVMNNLEDLKTFYPGYVIRLYHDRPRNLSDHKKLCHVFCQNPDLDLCNVLHNEAVPNLKEYFGMLWRFMPMMDPLVVEWHSRDLDSRLSAREQAAVKDWKALNKTIHVMRDNPYHTTVILGGLFGMVLTDSNRPKMADILRQMLKNSNKAWHKGLDQSLLSQYLWPFASKDMVAHDSYTCQMFPSPHNRPFPTQRVSGPNFTEQKMMNFVGSNGGIISKNGYAGPCPESCRPPEHLDWELC